MHHLTTVDDKTYATLQQLFTLDFINNQFALAGEISLALQIGHRKSVDLDFFSNQLFNIKELEIVLSGHFDKEFRYIGENSRMLFCEINAIKCDFVTDHSPVLHSYQRIDHVKYYSIDDIAAMKMHAISGRGKKKDFFDIYCLLQTYTSEELISNFLKKYDQKQLFFFLRSIIYFDDADVDPEIVALDRFKLPWKKVKEKIFTEFTK